LSKVKLSTWNSGQNGGLTAKFDEKLCPREKVANGLICAILFTVPSNPPQSRPPVFFARGRGTSEQPQNRFEQTFAVPDWEQLPGEELLEQRRVETVFIPDQTQSIISHNDSPDLPFRHSINPYRGCEHGCVYCYARPTHEYLGFNSGLDFETKIMVKARAPELLEAALANPRWEPAWVNMSGVTDCYQPAERRFGLTRGCLAVLARFRNPVTIVTKNSLVARDLDLLAEMARWKGAAVLVSLTTLDADLARRMEPRTVSPRQRLETVARLSEAGVPVGVNLAPIIPGLNDAEMPDLVQAATQAGACFAHYQVLRLPFSVKDLFMNWVEREFPLKKERIISRINDLRGGTGRLSDARFMTRMTGEGVWKETLDGMFALACRRAGLEGVPFELNTTEFRRPGPVQTGLPGFD
jgi:DNA repair photolyase